MPPAQRQTRAALPRVADQRHAAPPLPSTADKTADATLCQLPEVALKPLIGGRNDWLEASFGSGPIAAHSLGQPDSPWRLHSAGLAAAIGDPSRFALAPDFMAYLGLVPSEHSSGPRRRIGGITKSGDSHARTLLIEAAHSYRFPARITRRQLAAVDTVPEAVREIAWKTQTRLCQRYRHMMAKGKPTQVIVTAIARELAGFVWSIACITSDPPAKASAIMITTDKVTPPASTGPFRSPPRPPLKTTTHRAARPEQPVRPVNCVP